MSSLNKQFSDPRMEVEDYPVDVVGFSAFQRWAGPLVAKPGDVRNSRRGKKWFFGKASAAVATPATTKAVMTVTLSSGGIATIASIDTAGAGYKVGEVVPVLGGNGGKITVTTVNSTGGITAATIAAAGTAYTATSLTADVAAMPFTLCDIASAAAGTIGAGTAYRSYAPFAVDEYGWIESVA